MLLSTPKCGGVTQHYSWQIGAACCSRAASGAASGVGVGLEADEVNENGALGSGNESFMAS